MEPFPEYVTACFRLFPGLCLHEIKMLLSTIIKATKYTEVQKMNFVPSETRSCSVFNVCPRFMRSIAY